jgi:hypothetical protein
VQVLTIWIGANDLCEVCTGSSSASPAKYISTLDAALQQIHSSIPRVYVSLVSVRASGWWCTPSGSDCLVWLGNAVLLVEMAEVAVAAAAVVVVVLLLLLLLLLLLVVVVVVVMVVVKVVVVAVCCGCGCGAVGGDPVLCITVLNAADADAVVARQDRLEDSRLRSGALADYR